MLRNEQENKKVLSRLWSVCNVGDAETWWQTVPCEWSSFSKCPAAGSGTTCKRQCRTHRVSWYVRQVKSKQMLLY